MKNNKKLLLLLLILFLTILFFIFVLLFFDNNQSSLNIKNAGEIKIVKENGNLIVNKNGKVLYTDINGSTYADFWDTKKTSAFFGYYEKNYSDLNMNNECTQNCVIFGNGVSINSYSIESDELSEEVVDDILDQDNDENNGGSDEGNIDDYFDNSDQEDNQDGSEDQEQDQPSGIDPECEYWIISYCVRKRTPSPSPSATPISVSIYEPTCFDEGNQQTGRTVISNELCVPNE